MRAIVIGLIVFAVVGALSSSDANCNCPSVGGCYVNCSSPATCCGSYTMEPQCVNPSQAQCCTFYLAATTCSLKQSCCGELGPGASSSAFCCDEGTTCCQTNSDGMSSCCPAGMECCAGYNSACCDPKTEVCSPYGCAPKPITPPPNPQPGQMLWNVGLQGSEGQIPVSTPLSYNSTHLLATGNLLYYVRRSDGLAAAVKNSPRNPSSPVLVGNVVAVCGDNSEVALINLVTGIVANLSVDCDTYPIGFLVTPSGVIVANGDNQLTGIQPERLQVLWTFSLLYGNPFIITGSTIIISTKNYAVALNSDSGSVLWKNVGAACGLSNIPAPVVSGSIALVCNQFGVNVANGATVWKHTPLSSNDQTMFVADPTTNYFVCLNNSIVQAFDSTNGQLMWKTQVGKANSYDSWRLYAIPQRSMFVIEDEGHTRIVLFALNSGGVPLWSNVPTSPYGVAGNGAYSNGLWYVPGQAGVGMSYVVAIDTDSGSIIGHWESDSGVTGTPLLSNGVLYYGSENGYLYAATLLK